jgi:hypothetical protein
MRIKWTEKISAVVVGAGSVTLYTALLVTGIIGSGAYIGLLTLTAFCSLAIAAWSRLKEFNVREMKVVLAQLEEKKEELAAMYGGIEHIKRATLILDHSRIAELGLNPSHFASATGAMSYTIGVTKRERERLARIFIDAKSPEKIAEAIVDASLDLFVFKYDGPEVLLDAPAKSAEQRRIERGAVL